MSDLLVGYAVVAALAIGLFSLTVATTRKLSRGSLDLGTLLVVALLFAYIRGLWYEPQLARWFPFSNLIVVGNWLPLFAAIIAGLVWQRMSGLRGRRLLTVGELAACGIVAAVYPLCGSVPRCGERWDKLGTCLQTTKQTCSPACAATLLKKHGIDATEQEMAELCLTRHGTNWQGLYRGLKLKTAGTDWDVEVCSCSAEGLAGLHTAPMILSVGLDASEPVNTEFTSEFGWIPGVNHSVVLERFRPDGAIIISDPSQEMAHEHWDQATLRTLWRGHAFRLVRRN